MTEPIDWKRCEEQLFDACSSAIRQFAAEHPAAEVSSFILFSDYCYGQVAIALDTFSNSLIQVAEQVDRVNKSRAMLFNREGGWRDAKYFISRPSDRITDYTPSAGLFAYPEFYKMEFPEWATYFRSDEFSEEYGLDDRAIVFFWRVLESLVQRRVFDLLPGTGVLWIGFEFHDSPLGLTITNRIIRTPLSRLKDAF